METQYTTVVEVFNRSKKAIEFTWDGRRFIVPGATDKGPGKKAMLEAAAWHGRKVSVYNLSVYTLTGTPVLGIAGVHDHELDEEMPKPSATGEIINRDEITEHEGFGAPDSKKFSAGPIIEPKTADSGRVIFSGSAEAPFAKGSKVEVGAEE
jgi:hypothetical protein